MQFLITGPTGGRRQSHREAALVAIAGFDRALRILASVYDPGDHYLAEILESDQPGAVRASEPSRLAGIHRVAAAAIVGLWEMTRRSSFPDELSLADLEAGTQIVDRGRRLTVPRPAHQCALALRLGLGLALDSGSSAGLAVSSMSISAASRSSIACSRTCSRRLGRSPRSQALIALSDSKRLMGRW